jgi:predicted AlkP superfamily pyrophosphatase or phosphodiesterase
MKAFSFALAALLATPAIAEQKLPAAGQPPKLIVAISVDQFSADLFAEYRQYYTGGLKTLTQGVVFPSGYQSHAATETCPGHSTILTGAYPSKTGIIANNWIDLKAARTDKRIYCAEDETVPGSTADDYTVSPIHLKMPTLGDRLKAANPQSRVVSVAGKDRAAIMMGGHQADEMWWWASRSFVSFAGRKTPAIIASVNARIDALLSKAEVSAPLPAICQTRVSAVAVGDGKTVGGPLATREPGDTRAFRTTPAFDQATLDIAGGLIESMKLGRGPATDVISIGLSATDYVGHTFGTEGPESCAQILSMDKALGLFLTKLTASKVPFVVVLTADHGGHDLPERNRIHALPQAVRVDPDLAPKAIDAAVAEKLGIEGFTIVGDAPFGDFYVSKGVADADKPKVIATAKATLLANPEVAAVFTAEDFAGHKPNPLPVTSWSLLDRAAASHDDARSGDLLVLLKPYVTPIINGSVGYVATHGSPWDYDRRVPILFWSPGMRGFEQPNPVETVDILPTLASLIGLPITAPEIDGRCLDLDAGMGSNCEK